jgi:hypothetical protein
MGTRLDVSAFSKPDGRPYLSGTEWEFEDALNAKPPPQILVYRRTESPRAELADPALSEKIHQYQMVKDFFERFRNADGSFSGSFTTYATPSEFKERLSNDIRFILQERLKAARIAVEKGVPLASLRAVLARFGEREEVPEEKILARLAQLAEQYADLRKRFQWEPPTTELSAAETSVVNPRKLRAFLCHAQEDKDHVRKIYDRLLDADVEPWMDEQNLLPGQNWEGEIKNAIKNTDAILVFLSEASTSKSGYVNSEISQALDVAREQPAGRIFLIPARLEPCQVPSRLADIQYVDYFNSNGHDRLILALQALATWLNQRGSIVRSVLRGAK